MALLEKGFHLVYIDVTDLFGSSKAIEIWDFFLRIPDNSTWVCFKSSIGRIQSWRIDCLYWAIKNQDKISCIYADAPVCNLKSWPGVENEIMMKDYGFTKEDFFSYQGNPIDNLEPLAKAKIPILHIVGDADMIVPVVENTTIIEERYNKLGGLIQVIHKKRIGHHPHCLGDPTPIVEFILKYSKTK